MTHTVTILGERSNYGIENCNYEVEVEVSGIRSSILGKLDYSNSYIESIEYKDVDVYNHVLFILDEEDILRVIESGWLEIETPRLKNSVAV